MKTAVNMVADRKSQFERLREQKQKASLDMKQTVSQLDAQIAEAENALREAKWQEALEAAGRELGSMYLEGRRRQAQLASTMNAWIARAREEAAGICAMRAEVTGLNSSIRLAESRLLNSRPQDRDLLRKSIAQMKDQAVQQCEVDEQSRDAVKVLKLLGLYETSGTGSALPPVARGIYKEVQRAGGKLRIREGDLLEVAGIREERILAARDRLEKHLVKMQNDGLLEYSREMDLYLIRAKENAQD